MSKLSNDFSWSKSRNDIFNECPRKYYFYYYGSWGGWEARAPQRTRQLYILKKLKTRQMWCGEAVHNCLQRVLNGLQRGVPPLSVTSVQDLTLKSMRLEFRNSREKRYWQDPKSCALFEHEYGIRVSDEEWRKLAGQARLAIENFFDSNTYKSILALDPANIREIEKFSSFELDGYKINVKLDFACTKNNQTYIYDWKTGKMSPNAGLQLVCYALYARERWQQRLNNCKIVEYNLVEDKLNQFILSPRACEEVQGYILKSIAAMRELLHDKRHNEAREEDFAKTDNPRTCRWCNFLKECRPEPGDSMETAI